jgi:hypothetical protein
VPVVVVLLRVPPALVPVVVVVLRVLAPLPAQVLVFVLPSYFLLLSLIVLGAGTGKCIMPRGKCGHALET